MHGLLLSVVIPTLNEEKYLPSCLNSIISQKYDDPVNIIVSDNGSTDNTVKIAKRYKCFVIKGSKKGNVASARKAGYKKAKTLAQQYKHLEEIVINTDADTLLSKNYFQTVSQVFKNKEIVAASGPFIITNRKIPIKKFGKTMIKLHYLLIALELKFPWLLKKMRKNTFLYGANSCIRRSLYEKIGGWDTRFEKAEDLAMTLKLLKMGCQITYIDKLSVETSLRKFVNKEGNLDLRALYFYGKDQKIRQGVELAKRLFR